MKKLLTICGLLILSGCDAELEKAEYLSSAKLWMQQHNIKGTVSCNWHNCDVVPSDPRPPILLFCGAKTCMIRE